MTKNFGVRNDEVRRVRLTCLLTRLARLLTLSIRMPLRATSLSVTRVLRSSVLVTQDGNHLKTYIITKAAAIFIWLQLFYYPQFYPFTFLLFYLFTFITFLFGFTFTYFLVPSFFIHKVRGWRNIFFSSGQSRRITKFLSSSFSMVTVVALRSF